MFEIRECEGGWEIIADGERLEAFPTYELAVAYLAGLLTVAALQPVPDLPDEDEEPDDDEEDDDEEEVEEAEPEMEAGLLPETWAADLAFAEATGDGRDFTDVNWTARNPDESTLPLMLQTETEMGHFGAQLAGYFTELRDLGVGTNPRGRGRFYDTEAGRQLRDMLLDGRSFGVSVDPGAVDVDWSCTAEDADGFCVEEAASFSAYEIIGVTATPFPAFARASIRLDEPAVAASASLVELPEGQVDLLHPPADWFHTPEPQLGEPFPLGSLGDEWLVDQGQGRLAMPLHIGDDGRVLGHGAVWGAPHTGFPGRKITAPPSAAAYAHFHVGLTNTAEGLQVATGSLTASCDHAIRDLRAPEALDTYAHNGVAWANVRVTNGEHGPWVSGALRHDVTAEQVAVLRAGALSGDWRGIDGQMELIAFLAVTTPGFPIAREALVASGWEVPLTPAAAMAVHGGEQISLVAAGVVRRCPDCARRAAEAAATNGHVEQTPGRFSDWAVAQFDSIEATLTLLERRTRHLVPQAAEHAAHRIRR